MQGQGLMGMHWDGKFDERTSEDLINSTAGGKGFAASETVT